MEPFIFKEVEFCKNHSDCCSADLLIITVPSYEYLFELLFFVSISVFAMCSLDTYLDVPGS